MSGCSRGLSGTLGHATLAATTRSVRVRVANGNRMRFKAVIGEQVYAIELHEELLREAAEFHAKLDRDMDRGWQMSREFVERPDQLQRCQIVADRLLTGIMQNNEASAMLMAGYIASRMPGAIGVEIDTAGEMQRTELIFG